MRKDLFHKSNTTVIKIGTSAMLKNRKFDESAVKAIFRDVTKVIAAHPKKRFVIVTSGAIGAGLAVLGRKKRPDDLPFLQALAGLGQPELMTLISGVFKKRKLLCSQVLLTWNDFSNRKHYMKTRKAIDAMWSSGITPVINENDTISTEEIEFGDNDQLSSMVAMMLQAELHVFLSDSNGIYADYQQGESSRMPMIPKLDAKVFEWVHESRKNHTKGGMLSKLKAIEKSLKAAIPCVLADGSQAGVLSKLFAGRDIGTVFLPQIRTMSSRKQWIASLSKCEGSIVIDQGASEALEAKGRSLLASGILSSKGHFEAGSCIMIMDETGRLIGKGISNYTSSDLHLIKGKKTGLCRELIGHPCPDEVIHRDNFVKEAS